MIDMKDQAKPIAINYIKQFPACTSQDLFNYFTTVSVEMAHLIVVLMAIYQGGAFQAGLITTNTWEAFRDWIVATPVEIIMQF